MQLFYSVSIQKKNDTPIYKQIGDAFIAFIEKGYLPYGNKLPPIRKMAEQLKVNNDTIVGAYKYMEKKGYVCSQKGSGTYVCYQAQAKTPFNFQGFAEAMAQVLKTEKEKAFVMEDWQGPIALRGGVGQLMQNQVKVLPEHTYIVQGLKTVIEIILRSFAEPNKKIATSLTDSGFQALYSANRLYPILADDHKNMPPDYKITTTQAVGGRHILLQHWQEIHWMDVLGERLFHYISFEHLLPEGVDFGMLVKTEGPPLVFSERDFPDGYIQKCFEQYVKNNIMRI